MEKVTRYVFVIAATLIVIMSGIIIYRSKDRKNIENRWKEAICNVKSYGDQFSGDSSKRVFEITISQLKQFNDSIFKELDEARKELKVKDSKLRSLMYASSEFVKSDTVTLTDTIFKDPQTSVDTLLSDEWYSIRIGLRYPAMVTVEPKFKSVKYIVVSSRRETINPPKKFFLLRWFQKKHTVLNVDVMEKNPYIHSQSNRFVEIVR